MKMTWGEGTGSRVSYFAVGLMVVAAIICAAAGWYLNEAVADQASEPYAGGELLDVPHLVIYEDRATIGEIGWRLVSLAAGEEFTEEQTRQLKGLVSGLFREWRLKEPNGNEYYADGELIDATGSIVHEEDGDCLELGRRLVALASGDKFTEGQLEQLSELMAGLVMSVRENSIGVNELEWRLDKLEVK